MTAVTPTAASAATGSSAPQTAAPDDNALADYDDFLTLLTTQLQNQDPLNPAEGTEFVAQLATFTQLEQQVATVERLDQLIAMQTGDTLLQLATWIDTTVTATDGGVAYNGAPVQIETPGEVGASAGFVVFRNSSGQEAARMAIPPNGGPVTWDGQTVDGRAVPNGVYEISFEYTIPEDDGDRIVTRDLEVAGRVVEARVENDEPILFLDNGAAVRADAVTSVVAPPPATAADPTTAQAAEAAEPAGSDDAAVAAADEDASGGIVEDAADAVGDAVDTVVDGVGDVVETVVDAVT